MRSEPTVKRSRRIGDQPFRITQVRSARTISPEQLTHETLKELFERWCEAKGGSSWPRREDLQPETLRSALGRLMILQVEPGDPRLFRYRLVGTAIVESHLEEMTGQTTDDFSSQSLRRMLRAQHEAVLDTGQPLCARVAAEGDGQEITYEKVVLPVSSDGRAIDQLVACSFPIDPASVG
ncbi:MAG: PAS domain-containing protein [Kiloniellales bacterium]|nr:PAS domain-containing protein [Kiloniellales bacterium]